MVPLVGLSILRHFDRPAKPMTGRSNLWNLMLMFVSCSLLSCALHKPVSYETTELLWFIIKPQQSVYFPMNMYQLQWLHLSPLLLNYLIVIVFLANDNHFLICSVEAITCLNQAVNLFMEIGRLNMAARYCKVYSWMLTRDATLGWYISSEVIA